MQKTKSEIWDENMGKFLKIVKWWKAVLDLKCRSDKREVWYQKKKKSKTPGSKDKWHIMKNIWNLPLTRVNFFNIKSVRIKQKMINNPTENWADNMK